MQGKLGSYYPSYNVLHRQEHWDEHTKEIVNKRLGPFGTLKSFGQEELETVRSISQVLVADKRDDILDYLVCHLDQNLQNRFGEDQRPPQAPPKQELVLQGLGYLIKYCQDTHQQSFSQLEEREQLAILKDLEKGVINWSNFPVRHFFQYLKRELVSAYYSHPTIWSEIGHGGPAYPRGYVRTELGLTDPWEARKDGK